MRAVREARAGGFTVSSGLHVCIEPDASDDDVETVRAGLRAFNVARIGDPGEEPVHIFLRDAEGRIVGGLLGHIRWRWLYVAKLWIDAAHRGEGQGRELMKAAETHARSRGCLGSYLDTFEYQARPFYERLGYSLFGTLEGYPPGYRQYFLAKRLVPDDR
jgi:GNAT superfamily N-acetyltransferase